VLPSVQEPDEGLYHVVVSNEFVTLQSSPARLAAVCLEIQRDGVLTVKGTAGRTDVVRSTTNLANTNLTTWTPLATHTLSSPPWRFVDATSPRRAGRFYAVEPRP